ncbi:metal ABC transporter permease [Planosporangium mesophilum]|uniref:ABC transporter n=1 Tax=Planosporangium mesophilum TaxID=689768 RepID=A0A8J3TNM7_9ACTN|nr:metal ABC transporter permease [Planosporangium mesophilum]NJC85534.1 metal ABC transporter permease [Planosporangium mesophilum]GII24600.1 ABC transporter [Planosporangium mesophilum]
MNLFAYDFMIRALIGATVTGLAAPAIGIYLVQRRLSLIGDGLGHVALTGVGLGLLTHNSPTIAAVVVAALGAVAVELVRERGKASGDVALAILFYGGISGGVVLVNLSSAQSSRSLTSYLFGSPLTTSPGDIVVIGVLGAIVLAVALLLRPWLFAVCHDEEYARVSGLPIRLLNITLAVTTAVTVTAAMRAVGLLLVSALMVVPVATAQQVTRGFNATMYLAMALGVGASVVGLSVSSQLDTAPGATIVLLAIASFVAVTLLAGVVRRARPRQSVPGPPADAEPPEVLLDR